jgi:hypothetical protein
MRVSAVLAPASSSWLVSLIHALAHDTRCEDLYIQLSPQPLLSLSNVAVVETCTELFHLKILQRSRSLATDYVIQGTCLYIV